MVNDLLPDCLKPAEIAGLFLPPEEMNVRRRTRQKCDFIEIVEFFGVARFLQR
jgi:hypothetical protein